LTTTGKKWYYFYEKFLIIANISGFTIVINVKDAYAADGHTIYGQRKT
jgi:hypothetical protein